MADGPSRTGPNVAPSDTKGHKMLSPAELAQLTGVSTDTLRHYERKGVLALRLAAKADIDCIPPKPSRTYGWCVARWRSASA
jgi:MerR family regulatory protein